MSELLTPAATAALAIFAGGAAAFLLALVGAQRAAAAGFLLDRPNARSSHRSPRPRSGGVAIFVGWAAGMALAVAGASAAGWEGLVAPAVKFALLAGGVLLMGLADDLYGLPALAKLAGQTLAALAFVALFGGIETAPAPYFGEVDLGAFGPALTVFWIVAFMNAFNFMDGVNGIAGAAGALALAALAAAAAFFGAPFWALAAALAGAALVGFLPVNIFGGRLFMGDNGSQTAAFLIAAIAVGAARQTEGAVSALFLPTLMAPFLFDVALTLGRRAAAGRNLFAAHCEHVYQLIARMGWTHAAVAGLYFSLTAFSAAAAILMLRLAPAEQWLAPAALVALLAGPAAIVVNRASRRGLVAQQAREKDVEPAIEAKDPDRLAAAAE